MSEFNPSEKKFEEYIEDYFTSNGYKSVHHSVYNPSQCLISEEFITFIQKSQPEEWNKLCDFHGSDVENKVLNRITQQISTRGLLDVLRGEVTDHGSTIRLCYFKPKSQMNEKHMQLYKMNNFSVIRQLHFSERNPDQSIDMGLFINGIPLITIELKNQLTGQNIIHSQLQYGKRDKNEPLLQFKRCLAHFCIDNDKASMTTKIAGEKTFFLPYNKGIENPVTNGFKSEYMWREILEKDSVLDILENFVHLSKEKELFFNDKTNSVETKTNEILIFPRYHQLALNRKFKKSIVDDDVGHNYLVQHTTGSGKSYSIGWLAHLLTSLYKNENDTKRMFDSIIVVTDLTVLDDQLKSTIRSLQRVDGVVNGADSSEELKTLLEKGKDIIVTTIQKFPFISDTIASLKDKNFAVIIDEVHSSQSGEYSKELKKSLSKENKNEEDFDPQKYISESMESRGKQKNISFFGFSGTPKRKTFEVFGARKEIIDGEVRFFPFDLYSMKQSIHEGFTLDVLQNYTTYKRYFKIKNIKDSEIEIPVSQGKKKMVKFVEENQATISAKVNIILNHFIEVGSKEILGKSRGMIVVHSRNDCVKYFKETNKQLKERGINYRALTGFSGEVTVKGDDKKYKEDTLNQDVGYTGNIPQALKNPKYRLLIVANKFQTGFDEPLIQSMYINKKLGGVQCVQTLSRLNRTTKGKTKTFILDFINEVNDIKDAFHLYYEGTILEGETDQNVLYDIISKLDMAFFYDKQDIEDFNITLFDKKRDESQLHAILDKVVKKWTEKNKEEREEIRQQSKFYSRLYGYLSQILKFKDTKLEKYYFFLKYFIKKIPKPEYEKVDIDDLVDLDYLRIQKMHEGAIKLEEKEGVLTPPLPIVGNPQEPEKDLLSKIIKSVNEIYGTEITEEDKVNFNVIVKKTFSNSDIKKIMHGDNSDENKLDYFIKELNKEMVASANSSIQFYKKYNENEKVKKYIFKQYFDQYKIIEGIDSIENLIKKNEGKRHEYKSSFNVPYPEMPEPLVIDGRKVYKQGNKSFTSEKEVINFIQSQCLKTIVGFLNSKGGNLIIGVTEEDNEKKIISIENDNYENDDKYLLNITQAINNRIGMEFSSKFITPSIHKIKDKKVCLVKCEEYLPESNQTPALLDKEKLYVRTGNRTDEITGIEQITKFTANRIFSE